MKILLTGATGFVGQTLLRSFLPGDEVVCLGRSAPDRLSDKVTFIKTNISDEDSVNHAASQVNDEYDALVHLAAYVPKNSGEDMLAESYQTNITGTINLLEAFKGKFKKVVIGSTVEVYDQSKVSGEINESSPVGASSYYGVTKLASELIAQTYGKKENIPLIVLRFSVMYGPNDPISRALPNFIKSAIAGDPIIVTGGNKLRDYVSVQDVVRSIHAGIASGNSGVVNIGSGRGVSIRSAVKSIIEATQSTSAVTYENDDVGVDIVINPKTAESLIDFRSKDSFPEKLDEMIESYR